MTSEGKNVIIGVLFVILIIFALVNGSNQTEIEQFEDERLDYMVEIDKLEEENRQLREDCYQYEDWISELNSEIETIGEDLYGDAERYWYLKDEVYYVLNNSPYFHKPYGCFGANVEISDVYYKNSYLPSGYTLCPECY